MSMPGEREWVGPVLSAGDLTDALLSALRSCNAELEVLDRGAYVRVSAPGSCVLERAAVEQALGRPFKLPGDLELCMPSFSGDLKVSGDRVVWEARRK